MFEFLNANARNREMAAVIDVRGSYCFQQVHACVTSTVDKVRAVAPRCNCIVVYGSHGIAVYVGILAALASGTRIVFVDQATPIRALETTFTALGASVLLNCSGIGNLSLTGAAVIDIEDDAISDQVADDAEPCPVLELRGFDYAILTSGTAGEPKVILQTIAALSAHIANYAGYVGMRGGDRILQLASAGWDAGLMDIFSCLLNGCTLCTISPRHHELGDVKTFIELHGIDTLHMTVPYFRRIYADHADRYAFTKKLVLGGELIHEKDIALFNAAFAPSSELYNAYGPTECTTALYARHAHGSPSGLGNWPLTHPVDGVSVALLQEGAVVKASHVIGEIIIQSELLARRFNVQTATSAEITATDPGVDGRYYATGDLAYYDDNQNIVVTGRTDSIIKINGQKVSLHEIEATLRSFHHVRDVCVLALDEDEEKHILAAVVPALETTRGIALRQQLAGLLPGHKVPKHFLMLPALPLNKNNKLDRSAIVQAFRREIADQSAVAVELHSLEHEVSRVLGGAAIEAGLSFLDNGGDSLRALQLITTLRRRGVLLGLEQLLSDMPIRNLTLVTPSQTALVQVPNARARPLLPNRRFLETRGIRDLDSWCQTCVLECLASVGVEKTKAVLRAVLERHVKEWAGSDWRIDFASDLTIEEAVAASEARISLSAGSVLSGILAPGAATTLVIISCHQFYVDRYSWILLLSELADGTHGDEADIQNWSEAPQYSSWAAHYSDTLEGVRASEFWQSLGWDHCGSMVEPNIPFPLKHEFERVVMRFGSLDSAPERGASKLGRVSDLLLAAILIGLVKRDGNQYQKLHILDHGREVDGAAVETHGIFGWFTIIYPLVVRVLSESLLEVAEQVAKYKAETMRIAHTFGNEFFGTELSRRAVGKYDCDMSYNFLGDIEMSASGDWIVNEISINTLQGAPSHHLEFTGFRSGGELILTIDYDGAVYGDELMKSLSSCITHTLGSMCGESGPKECTICSEPEECRRRCIEVPKMR